MRAVAMRSWLAKGLMIVLLVDVGGYSATAQTGELEALNRQVEELYYDGKYECHNGRVGISFFIVAKLADGVCSVVGSQYFFVSKKES